MKRLIERKELRRIEEGWWRRKARHSMGERRRLNVVMLRITRYT